LYKNAYKLSLKVIEEKADLADKLRKEAEIEK